MLPLKKLTGQQWLINFSVWTLAAISIATQAYLNNFYGPGWSWISLLIYQLPPWYLCALLTPVIIHYYDEYPLDGPSLRQHLFSHLRLVLVVLPVFSLARIFILRLFALHELTPLTVNTFTQGYIAQLAWDLALYTLIMIAVFAWRSNTRRREHELKATQATLQNLELLQQLNQAQLEALKLQLSPHFLFNALNTVSSLIRTKQFDIATNMIARLGEFLRESLYADNRGLVPLEDELRFADLYLDIEAIRFANRLNVDKDIDPKTWKLMVPHFILQPLIENGIKHGISKSRDARLVNIKTSLTNEGLIIALYNDGPYLSDENLNAGGIGIRNTKERLQKVYDSKATFTIHNHQQLHGVEVILNLPLLNDHL